jgi:hypothetical protein
MLHAEPCPLCGIGLCFLVAVYASNLPIATQFTYAFAVQFAKVPLFRALLIAASSTVRQLRARL